MKRNVIIIWIIVIINIIGLIFLFKMGNDYNKAVPLFEKEEYKNIKLDNIKKITVNKYRESGTEIIEETEIKDIRATYKYLEKLKIGKESKTSCEDNTTIYVIELENDVSSIEIECNNLVINNKRYQIKK